MAADAERTASGTSGGVGGVRREDAFEARDMENDVLPDYGGRIERLERVNDILIYIIIYLIYG